MTNENVEYRQTAALLYPALLKFQQRSFRSLLILAQHVCALATEQTIKPNEISIEVLRVLTQAAHADLIDAGHFTPPPQLVDEYWLAVCEEVTKIIASDL